MEERGGFTGWGVGLEGLCAGEGDVTGSPGEREGTEGVSGAGREAEEGEEGLGIGLGLPAAGLVATGDGLMAADVNAFTGLGAVGGPRGLGDTGGGTRCLGSVQTKKIMLFFCYCTVRLSGNISAGFTSTKCLWGGCLFTSHLGSVPSQWFRGRGWGLGESVLEAQLGSSSG